MKLCSCMTLFSFVSKDTIFDEVLEKYFMGHKDKLTINKLT